MRRLMMCGVLLMTLAACGGSDPESEPDVFTTQDAEQLCVDSIIEWRARDEGDEAYSIDAESDARAVCDTMLAERNRDY